MLAGRDQHAARHVLPQIAIAPVVVGDQRLFDPLQPVLVGGNGQPGGVVEVERHPAVPHQPEVVADLLPHRRQFGDVGLQPGDPFVRTVVQGHLAADETHLLGQVGPGAGGVEDELVADRSAQQVVDRLLPDAAQQVPEGQVDGADDIEHQPLAAVEEGGPPHLVPDQLGVGDQRALEETRQVLLDDPRAGLPRGGDAEPDRAVVGLHLDHQGAEHVDAEAAAALVVARIARHRGGDVVVDPVVALLIVVVRSPARADGEGADVGDAWRAHDVRVLPAGRPGSCSPYCGPGRGRRNSAAPPPSRPGRRSATRSRPARCPPRRRSRRTRPGCR